VPSLIPAQHPRVRTMSRVVMRSERRIPAELPRSRGDRAKRKSAGLPQNEAMRERIGAAIERARAGKSNRCERLPGELGISPRHLTGFVVAGCLAIPLRACCCGSSSCRADEMLRYGDRR